MTDKTKQRLIQLRERQDTGERMPCARCGLDTMDENLVRNALSRQADISICELCGVAEALDAFRGTILSPDDWACMREE